MKEWNLFIYLFFFMTKFNLLLGVFGGLYSLTWERF